MRKAHQTQFPETPLVRTMSVTKLGVSVENVVATIERPNIHQGMFLPDRKKALALLPEDFETKTPIPNEIKKNTKIMSQSIKASCIFNLFSYE